MMCTTTVVKLMQDLRLESTDVLILSLIILIKLRVYGINYRI